MKKQQATYILLGIFVIAILVGGIIMLVKLIPKEEPQVPQVPQVSTPTPSLQSPQIPNVSINPQVQKVIEEHKSQV